MFEELGRTSGRGTAAGVAARHDRYWTYKRPTIRRHEDLVRSVLARFHPCTFTVPLGVARSPFAPTLTLPLFKRESTAFRFPAILMSGLLAVLVFRFARTLCPRPAAAAGAVLAIAQPHYFFHAPIACFDAPITTMAFAVGFAYWKSLRQARWGILCGVIFGIALGVKHNAWLMPVFLAGHYIWMRRKDLRRLRPPRVPLAFVSMAVLVGGSFSCTGRGSDQPISGCAVPETLCSPRLQIRVPGPKLFICHRRMFDLKLMRRLSRSCRRVTRPVTT